MSKLWDRTHREQKNKHHRNYNLRHPEKYKAKNQAQFLRKKLGGYVTMKAWREKNRAKLSSYDRKYRDKNPEKIKTSGMVSRARRRGVLTINPKSIIAWELVWKSKDLVRCYWCSGMFQPSKCHKDHIVPLIRNGTNDLTNLCISCSGCNCRKGPKMPSEWNLKLKEPVLLLQ